MNKKYQSPALEVLSFDKEDIVTASIIMASIDEDTGDAYCNVSDYLGRLI